VSDGSFQEGDRAVVRLTVDGIVFFHPLTSDPVTVPPG
jgi:hypothetical protein